jgi:hypothetical protein
MRENEQGKHPFCVAGISLLSGAEKPLLTPHAEIYFYFYLILEP